MSGTSAFTIDRPRQCRARGHVFSREAVINNAWTIERSETCFRCDTSVAEAAKEELSSEF